MKNNKNSGLILGFLACALALALIFVRTAFPETIALTAVVAVLLLAVLGLLIQRNHRALRSRTAAYGLNSAVTIVLVLGILAVLNFIAIRYPYKLDLTKNQVNTLSDQTVKVVKGLKAPVHAVVFTKGNQKEQVRPILDNYRALNPKFEVEYVDPDREVSRTQQAGIRKLNTVQLISGTRENKVDDVTEEKLTNALIKLLKDKTPTICATTGHGEKNFSSQEADGYSVIKKALEDQSYAVKDLNIVQEGKIPATCDAVAVMGPSKAFFENEIKAIREFLANGGRMVVGIDPGLKGTEPAPELLPVLESWNVHPVAGLIVDPISQMFNMDASVALVTEFSKESAITRGTQERAPFPLTRPLDVTTSTPGVTGTWLGRTTPNSWLVTDMKQLSTGQVKFVPGKNKNGPFNVAVSAEGKPKDSKATRNTRLVVFGSSNFAANHFARFGGNLDLMVNAISWLVEDESLISIRPKEEAQSRIELTQKSGIVILWLTVILIPLAIAAAGIVIWAVRRRL